LPALRILRVFRALRVLQAARTLRTVSLLRLVTSLNRGMRATAAMLGRHRVGYVVALTVIVIFAGAAGMLAFESQAALSEAGFGDLADDGAGFDSYGEAVWWTAMLITTIGSDYWPVTVEGRVLCWLLSVYALAIFGYITAAVASFFIRQRPEAPTTPG
jgi:voltage-gated potassium channel